MSRISNTFSACKEQGRGALIAYTMAYDPDPAASQAFLNALPEAGADIIELGVPFSDPMADGPVIQAAANRALEAGASVKNTLAMATAFRKTHPSTPIILMGYYNPFYHYGLDAFVKDALTAGVDGVIIVDLPPEEEKEFTDIADPAGLALIRLVAPTTTPERAKQTLKNASGFVYYISIAGITGTSSAKKSALDSPITALRSATDLPIAVGFGIKTPEQAAEAASLADGVVVGSALIEKLNQSSDEALDFIRSLRSALST